MNIKITSAVISIAALFTIGLTACEPVDETATPAQTNAAPIVEQQPQEEPNMTAGQKNAVRSAESYLEYSGFSRLGLIQQLTSEYGEGFEPADAEFAVAYLEQSGEVDWNAEAVESAENYLDYSAFSREGLVEQLTSEYGDQYTLDQATYAVDQVGL